jgi:SAM-dependent methyltransferase
VVAVGRVAVGGKNAGDGKAENENGEAEAPAPARAGWLALREPHDHAARSLELTRAFAKALASDALVIDLGCGTGSNYRYLRDKLAGRPRWLCVDHDEEHLAAAATALAEQAEGAEQVERAKKAEASDVRLEQLDLARGLSSLPLDHQSAITTSAFLELTPAAWLDDLASRCSATPLLAAMNFDGRIFWEPAARDDEAIRLAWLEARQADEGFGSSLGPEAVVHLAGRLKKSGQRVRLARSDWQIGSGDRPLLEAMVEGIARRIRATRSAGEIEAWVDRRNQQIEAGNLRLLVGHVDLLSLPVSGRFQDSPQG